MYLFVSPSRLRRPFRHERQSAWFDGVGGVPALWRVPQPMLFVGPYSILQHHFRLPLA